MKRALFVLLSLALALVAWGAACAQQDGFYVIPVPKSKYAPVPKTGQTTSYGTRDDGALQKGVAWPTPRFTDNNNGTVTDNLTGLIWTKNADAFGERTWNEALDVANNLKSGDAGLTDGSRAGDWRLPNVRELQSLIDYGRFNPALPEGHPFTNIQMNNYWSSSASAEDGTYYAWLFCLYDGWVGRDAKSHHYSVWCVRAGPY